MLDWLAVDFGALENVLAAKAALRTSFAELPAPA